LSTLGIGLFAVLVILFELFVLKTSYVLPTILIPIIGLVLAAVGFISWATNRWVRESVTSKQLAGEAAWPVRAESKAGRWIRVGVLEADALGIKLTIRNGKSVEAAWSEFETIGLHLAGFPKARSLVVEGPRSGRLELELLRGDAITREDDAGVQVWARQLEDLRSHH
jgi:hypothetical protein